MRGSTLVVIGFRQMPHVYPACAIDLFKSLGLGKSRVYPHADRPLRGCDRLAQVYPHADRPCEYPPPPRSVQFIPACADRPQKIRKMFVTHCLPCMRGSTFPYLTYRFEARFTRMCGDRPHRRLANRMHVVVYFCMRGSTLPESVRKTA